jgi:[ribosomal protein S5]-alanine N-acetyltransferase
MSFELRTTRLRLRPAATADAEALATLTHTPDAEGKLLARVQALVEQSQIWFIQHRYGLWVIEPPGPIHVVGWVGLRPRDHPETPELLYGLAPTARGQGLATEAVDAVITSLCGRPDIVGVWAVTDPSNTASARLLERVGLPLDRRGEFDGQDSLIYRLFATAWQQRAAAWRLHHGA